MTRLQKKCLVFSAGAHGTLLVILVVTSAFRSKPSESDEVVLTMIPAQILDRDGAGGGGPVAAADPAPSPAPSPAQEQSVPTTPITDPAPPAPVQTHVEHVVPLTSPHQKPSVPLVYDPPKTSKTPTVAKVDKPTHETKTSTETRGKHVIVPTFDPVKIASRGNKPSSTRNTSAQSDSQNNIKEVAHGLGDLASAIRSSGGKATVVTLPGAGGGEAFIGYETYVFNAYNSAWVSPKDTADIFAAIVKIVVLRDGTIQSAEITTKSGDAAMDASVQRALDKVTHLPPFPEKATDSQRSFSIRFNLEAKQTSE